MMFSKESQLGYRKSKHCRGLVSLKRLDATCWAWFSKMIRLRDADENGFCKCFTCYARGHWKCFQAGHFVKRNRLAVKFHKKNVHAQCVSCNRWQKGNEGIYAVNLDKRYGAGTAEMLVDLGRTRGAKLGRDWYEYHIGIFKTEANLLLREKGLVATW